MDTSLAHSLWPGMIVLMVEDNAMNRQYLEALLDKWEILYDYAPNGKEALYWVNQRKYSLILMDIQMPVMDGYDATLAIRNTHNLNQHTPIIALTASTTDNHKKQAFGAGMNSFLSKPFTPSQLQEVLLLYRPTEPLPTVEKQPESLLLDLPLDHAQLQKMYGDDRAYLIEMFTIFLNKIVPEIESLTVDAGLDALKKTLHKVKPTFSMVGLTDLQTDVRQLEEACYIEQPLENLSGPLAVFLEKARTRIPIVHEYLRQQSAQ